MVTDGSPNSARLVSWPSSGVNPGVSSSDPSDLTVVGDQLFFAATDGVIGREVRVLSSITGLLNNLDINTGAENSNPSSFASSGTLPVYFAAFTPLSGRELWKSDGTVTGTALVKDINIGIRGSDPQYLIFFRNKLYFSADDGINGRQLWTYDPSSLVTQLMYSMRGGGGNSFPSYLTVMTSSNDQQEYLLFTATDGLYLSGNYEKEGVGGGQLWRSDGTQSGTQRVLQRSSNDFYFDREGLEMLYPKRFTVVGSVVFLAGRYDPITNGQDLSRRLDNEVLVEGVSQSVLIVDDSPVLTVSLHVNQGCLLLSLDTYTDSTASHHDKYSPLNTDGRVLIVSDDPVVQTLLASRFISIGISADTAMNGTDAFDRIFQTSVSNHSHPVFHRYDMLITDINLQSHSSSWDGLQLIRKIRHEERIKETDRRSDTVIGEAPVIIVAMGIPDDVPNEEKEAIDAGASVFLIRPKSQYSLSALHTKAGLFEYVPPSYHSQSTVITDELTKRLQVSDDIEDFVNALMIQVMNLYPHVFRHTYGQPSLQNGIQSLAVEVQHIGKCRMLSHSFDLEHTLSDAISGENITITGSPFDVNRAMRRLFFLALDARDRVDLTVSVVDSPEPCVIPAMSFVQTNKNNSILCDLRVSYNASVVIPVFSRAHNRRPEIHLLIRRTDADLNKMIGIPGVSVEDKDHRRITELIQIGSKDSLANSMSESPSASVVITCRLGRVLLLITDDVSLVTSGRTEGAVHGAGSDLGSRSIMLRGSIENINTSLSSLRYICRVVDGCTAPETDIISITIDDEGVSGIGGALFQTEQLNVNILDRHD